MRIQNAHCNWLAKNMLYEYISKWFMAGHEIVVWRESSDTSASIAFIFSTAWGHKGVDK